jgi:hypothetical protein
MKAAIAALPFEHPTLAVTALVDGGNDWAARIERARLRSAKVIELRPAPSGALRRTVQRCAGYGAGCFGGGAAPADYGYRHR